MNHKLYNPRFLMAFIIEIATTDFITAKAAVAGGADRIELCSALSEGGLTPSYGLVKACRQAFEVDLFPILRPRNGDFLYTDEEFEIILQDALYCKAIGCNGIVTGFLARDGSIDKERTQRIAEAAYPLEVTFHRAFDRCIDPFQALEDIIACGCQRILTSGQQPTAPQGAGLIAGLVKAAGERISIMPGSGITPSNVKAIAEETGATEFHASLRSTVSSAMAFIHPSFNNEESYSNPAIDSRRVMALKAALHS